MLGPFNQMSNSMPKPISRRNVVLALVTMPVTRMLAADDGESVSALMGSWHVTSAVTSIILSVEPQGEALGVLIENGAHTLWRSKWRKLPGGILVDGQPMIRLWIGRNKDEARAEMESLPEDMEVSAGIRQFPLSFFMRRVPMSPRNTPSRKYPPAWENGSLGTEWDRKAGRRRTSGKQN